MATITPRNGGWQLNWTDPNGTRRRKSLGKITKSFAKDILKAKQIEILTGANPVNRTLTFNLFADRYLTWYGQQYPSSHNRVYQIVHEHVLPTFGETALGNIDPLAVEAWKTRYRKKPVKAGTITKELRTLKAMLNQARKWRLIREHPILDVEAPRITDSKPPRFYTVDEMKALYKGSPNHRWIWQFMVNTGLRRAEAQQLKVEHIEKGHIHIISAENARTKSGKWRLVPLNDAAKHALKKLDSKDGYILPKANAVSLSRAFSNCLRRAQLDGSLHCLRHTYCSHLVIAGVDLRTVQTLAGHAHYSTTEKYARLAPEHLQSSAKLIRL